MDPLWGCVAWTHATSTRCCYLHKNLTAVWLTPYIRDIAVLAVGFGRWPTWHQATRPIGPGDMALSRVEQRLAGLEGAVLYLPFQCEAVAPSAW